MKKKHLILIGIILIVVVVFLVCLRVMLPCGVCATEDVGDYNTAEYPLHLPIFLNEIPSYAEVASFSYYNYWNEANDYYLELKFSSRKEMEDYLSQWQTAALETLRKDGQPANREWFVTDQNPYNSSYTDIFCTTYITFTAETEYTGYSIEPSGDSQNPLYRCNFGVISYSFDELTVIQTYVHGHFREAEHHHVPRFFLRFDVPLDERYERRFYFD